MPELSGKLYSLLCKLFVILHDFSINNLTVLSGEHAVIKSPIFSCYDLRCECASCLFVRY